MIIRRVDAEGLEVLGVVGLILEIEVGKSTTICHARAFDNSSTRQNEDAHRQPGGKRKSETEVLQSLAL